MKTTGKLIFALSMLVSAAGCSSPSAAGETPVVSEDAGWQRDWSQYMELPSEEQISQPGTFRSPYIVINPSFYQEDFTAYSMDLRIDHDPNGTYICPACWDLDTGSLESDYQRIWSDYGDKISGYFGFQVLDDGTKVVIMSLWDAFFEDHEGNISQVKAKVLFPENIETKFDNDDEGSFTQCIYEYDWETGKDYRFVLEQTTGENGTELFTLWLMEPEGETQTEMFCFDSGLKDVRITGPCGFLENFEPEFAAAPRSVEFWNVRGREAESGEWISAPEVRYTVNNSIGIEDYEGCWNFGSDENSCWIITSGIPGLCPVPDADVSYPIPSTESGAPN